MITHEQIDILLDDEMRAEIIANINADPSRVALSAKRNGALISTQIKYLQRSRTKIPSFYDAQCIIEPLAYEQCSSELAASYKNYAGELCIDLTCGMGVDSLHFSRHFRKVISIERNEELHRITKENMTRLAATNIELVNTSAEEFMAKFTSQADMIYVDPARRSSTGGKLYLMEHCSPNVVDMLEDLLQKTKLLVIKASPLFDIKEAVRLFGDGVTIEAVSVGGECKELIIEVDPQKRNDPANTTLKATMAGCGSIHFTQHNTTPTQRIDSPKYLLIPDVSIYKLRKIREYASLNGFCCDAHSDNGYLFSQTKPDNFFGRIFDIEQILPYAPKKLKAKLKADGIKQADILKKDFPYSSSDIARALGIKEGGITKIAFTRINNIPMTIIVKDE